jgi:hypothetical protein
VQNSGNLCYYYGAGVTAWLAVEIATQLKISSASLQEARSLIV